MPTNWKYIKKQLEKEFLCEKLRKRITYDLTQYEPAPWYQQHFIMKYDDEVLFEARQPHYFWDKRAIQIRATSVGKEYADSAHANGIYGVEEIVEDIGVFLHSDIQESIKSSEYFVAALAVLDRRIGKRTLDKYAKSTCSDMPDWLKRIFRVRFETEGIRYSDFYSTR